MTSVHDVLLTEEGWQKLREELSSLQERWKLLLKGGALTNASQQNEVAIDATLTEIDFVRMRIAHLESILRRAVPVSISDREPGAVGVGSQVSVRWENGDEQTYIIVGPPEIDGHVGRISYESPVGKALMGSREGECLELNTPAGPRRLLVLAVR